MRSRRRCGTPRRRSPGAGSSSAIPPRRISCRRRRSSARRNRGSEGMASCPTCGSENREGARFCDGCGGKIDLEIAETGRSEEHTSELQTTKDLVCRLLLEKKKKTLK